MDVPSRHSPLRQASFQEYAQNMKAAIDEGYTIVAVDETGFDQRTVPTAGYVQKGQRLYTQRDTGGWSRTSVVMAVTNMGYVHHMACNGAFNACTFLQFIEGGGERVL
jgi:hypothetical protein